MKSYHCYCLFLLAYLVLACSSSPLNQKYESEASEEQLLKIEEANVLSDEELLKLLQYVRLVDEDSLNGRTYSKILESANKLSMQELDDLLEQNTVDQSSTFYGSRGYSDTTDVVKR